MYENRIKKNFGVRKIRRGGSWPIWAILILAMGLMLVAYREQYQPRIQAKNYTSYAVLTICGIEAKMMAFENADSMAQGRIIESFSRLWNDFCAIDLPDDVRSEEIQWKMAKLIYYVKALLDAKYQGRYLGDREADMRREINERIADLRYLIDDTIAYGNFKRWR